MVYGSGFSLDSHSDLVLVGENWREKGRGVPTGLLWTATKSLRLSEEIICGPLFGLWWPRCGQQHYCRCQMLTQACFTSIFIGNLFMILLCILQENRYGLRFSFLAGGGLISFRRPRR